MSRPSLLLPLVALLASCGGGEMLVQRGCRLDADCAEGLVCRGGACQPQACDGGPCAPSPCVGSSCQALDCGGCATGVCDSATNRCVECTADADCPTAKPRCDRASNVCVGACAAGMKLCNGSCIGATRCCTDSDCASGASCQAGSCACPSGTKECNGQCIPLGDCCSDADCKSPPHSCRASAGTCNAGTCDYAAAPAGTVCRAAASACDLAEECDGTGAPCPTDGLASAGTVCRPAAGPCDKAEACNGTDAFCPQDALVAAGVTCRSAGGACDVAEACDGQNPSCPADAVKPYGSSCADDGQVCTQDLCDGAGACIHPARPEGVSCGLGRTCRSGQCRCTDCTSGACCGWDSFCDGKPGKDMTWGYDGVCTSSLPSSGCAGPADAMVADPTAPNGTKIYQGAAFGCVKKNGSYTWLQRVPTPHCTSMYPQCTYICSGNMGYQAYCVSSGAWSQTVPSAECGAPAASMQCP